MRLLFNPSNEIFFKKLEDQRMGGVIEMNNPTSDTIFAFKVKCTNPDLFMVVPLKGVIKAGEKISIQFKTNDQVSVDLARQLASKHKFLIEFASIASELAIPNFQSQQSDRKKYLINMNTIRGSQLYKDQQKISMQSGVSNKMSYISMKNQQIPRTNNYLTPRKTPQTKFLPESPSKSINPNQQLHEKYSKLKEDLQDLHRQRQQIVNKMSITRKSSKINLKKLIIFIICLIFGYFLGNFLKGTIENQRIQAQMQKKKKEKQQSSFWNIFSLDRFYDQI